VDEPVLRTDEQRALVLMADGDHWLGAQPSCPGCRARAWVQLSKYRGDEIPVGWDVFERLLEAGYLTPGRRVRETGRQFWLTTDGRRATDAASSRAGTQPPPPPASRSADPHRAEAARALRERR
jgi:hypothetical protein